MTLLTEYPEIIVVERNLSMQPGYILDVPDNRKQSVWLTISINIWNRQIESRIQPLTICITLKYIQNKDCELHYGGKGLTLFEEDDKACKWPCKSPAVHKYQPTLSLTLEPFKEQEDTISEQSDDESPYKIAALLVEI